MFQRPRVPPVMHRALTYALPSAQTPRNRSIDLTTVASNYHIEINPGDAGIYDRFVVQDIIKEIAQSPPLDDAEFKGALCYWPAQTCLPALTPSPACSGAADRSRQLDARCTGGSATYHGKVRAVVAAEQWCDVTSVVAGDSCLTTPRLYRYTANCRLILCCQSPSKVIDPVRSRCLGIRVAAPTNDEVVTVLSKVAAKERFNLPEEFAMSVAKAARRNMRRALLMLEACKVQK